MKWLMEGKTGARLVRLLLVVGTLVAADVGLLPDRLADAAREVLLGA